MAEVRIHEVGCSGRVVTMTMPVSRHDRSLWRCASRFLADERGQDLIEYALLTGAVGLVGVSAWSSIGSGIGTAYTGWDTGVQNIWEPPNPSGP